jgi:hypothetical protein
MKRVLPLVLLPLLFGAAKCPVPAPSPSPSPTATPTPAPTPTPTPTPAPECLPGVPWCHDLVPPAQCSSVAQPCKHNPTQDPAHCELAPACATPEPPPTPPPPTPPPPAGGCAAGICPNLFLIIGPHGQQDPQTGKPGGFDATPRCRDQAYCEKATGIPGVTNCALGPEGTIQREICEAVNLGAPCVIAQQSETGSGWARCLPEGESGGAMITCDHWDRWVEGTPYTGRCQRNADGNPIAGTPAVAHGRGYVRACNADASVCSAPLAVDH